MKRISSISEKLTHTFDGYIEVQAIFATFNLLGQTAHLQAFASWLGAVKYSFPGLSILRLSKSQLTKRRLGVRYAIEAVVELTVERGL